MANTKSLYSTVMHGKGITTANHFIERALSSMREFMEEDGQGAVYERFIASASGSVRFSKALNRSVTGSMNDRTKQAEHWLAEGDISLFDIGFWLKETPMSALKHGSFHHGFPGDVFEEMVSSVEP